MAYPQRSPRPQEHTPPGAPPSYQHSPLSNHVRAAQSASAQSAQAMNTPPRHQMPPGATYPDDALQQAEEQQSIYRDSSAPSMHEYSQGEYQNSNSRKRLGPEIQGNENPKKRAAVACNICRQRKSKCDGGRPRCRLCSELNAQCVYQEPGIKLDAGDKIILEHLDRIENFLGMNWAGHPGVAAPVIPHPPAHNTTAFMGNGGLPDGVGQPSSFAAKTAVMYDPNRQDEQIPLMRPIPTWPKIQDLVSAPFDPQSLLDLERERATIELRATLSLDVDLNYTYVRAFFEKVAVWNAAVNPYDWDRYYAQAHGSGFREGPESCFVLLVIALGAASLNSQPSPDNEAPGMSYFSAALGLLSTLVTSHSILSSQCTILACNYLLYLARPLEAWTLLSSTLPRLQVLLGKSASIPQGEKELCTRVYWNAILLESACLTALDLPASNLAKTTSPITILPSFFRPELSGEPRETSDDHPAFLTAMATLLSLKEQINVQTALPDSTQGQIAASLDIKLTDWYTMRVSPNSPAPASVPPPPRGPIGNPVSEYLRAQYWLMRMQIYRPYILAALTDESMTMQPITICRESCRKCLEAATRVLEELSDFINASPWHKWQSALAAVDAVLIVMAATRSQFLSLQLPRADHVNNILAGSVLIFQSLKNDTPSLGRVAEVLRVAEEKRMELVAKV